MSSWTDQVLKSLLSRVDATAGVAHLDRYEVETGLMRHSSGKKRLAATCGQSVHNPGLQDLLGGSNFRVGLLGLYVI